MNKRFLLMMTALAALLVCPQKVAAETKYELNLGSINATASGESNTCTYNETGDYYEISIPGAWGMSTWELGTFDASAYDYLVVELAEVPTTTGCISIYNATSIWGTSAASTSLTAGGTTIKIKLADCTITTTTTDDDGNSSSSTTALDKSAITIVGFQSWEDSFTLKVKSVYFYTDTDLVAESVCDLSNFTNMYNFGDENSTEMMSVKTNTESGVTTLTFGANAYIRQNFSSGLDLSSYRGFTIKMTESPKYYDESGALKGDCTASFRIGGYSVISDSLTNVYQWSDCNLNGQTSATVDLTATLTGTRDWTSYTSAIDITKITYIDFWAMPLTNGYTGTIKVEDFKLVPMNESVTVTDMCYATYCPEYNMDFTDSEIKVYTAKVSGSDLVLTRVYKVPAGAGVLLYCADAATDGLTENVNTTLEDVDELTNNDLVGTPTEITSFSGGYVLANVDNTGVGFYQALNATVPAGKAYLPSTAVSSGAKGLSIVFNDDDGTTGISTVATSEADTTVKTIYNLAGQRLSAPQKGLNIINGKKVIIK